MRRQGPSFVGTEVEERWQEGNKSEWLGGEGGGENEGCKESNQKAKADGESTEGQRKIREGWKEAWLVISSTISQNNEGRSTSNI